jgi:hypothetical protein
MGLVQGMGRVVLLALGVGRDAATLVSLFWHALCCSAAPHATRALGLRQASAVLATGEI